MSTASNHNQGNKHLGYKSSSCVLSIADFTVLANNSRLPQSSPEQVGGTRG